MRGQQAVGTFVVGRLYFSTLRDYLSRQIFLGKKFMVQESSGFIQKTFTIKGDVNDVNEVYKAVTEWIKKLEE